MELFYTTLLAVCAFFLGSCPFSVWIGHWLLGREIRDFGDGNPGAANVLRAGGLRAGSLALVLDVGKGVPFVALAYSYFGLPEMSLTAIGLSAILGHAFSPFLRFRGGKSVAVTYGVLLALPQRDMLFLLAAFMVLGFLFLASHGWAVMLGPTGSVAYLVYTGASTVKLSFMLCLLALFAFKHFSELQTVPRLKLRIVSWLPSRRRN